VWRSAFSLRASSSNVNQGNIALDLDEARCQQISDSSFLERLASPVLVDVEQELDELGEFVLVMAQERARAAGIEAEALVRRGDFKSVIYALVEEL
jgi:hypothetical protein